MWIQIKYAGTRLNLTGQPVAFDPLTARVYKKGSPQSEGAMIGLQRQGIAFEIIEADAEYARRVAALRSTLAAQFQSA